MRRSLGYALLLSVPAGTTMGSGIWLLTGQETTGVAAGVLVGVLVFGLVLLGREYGSADESLAGRP